MEGKQLILDEKLFQPVSADKLVIGNKYIFGCGFSGIYKGSYLSYRRFEQIYDLIKKIDLRDATYNYDGTEYYEFISRKERIQQAMEQRALDKILKRLVNDDFTW